MHKILGIVLGGLIAIAILYGVERLDFMLYPIQLDIDSDDPALLASVIADLPLAAKLMVVGGWFVGALAGAWLALRISDWKAAGWIVALFVIAGAVATILSLPHPVWMQICAVALPLVGGAIGIRLHHKPYPGEPLIG